MLEIKAPYLLCLGNTTEFIFTKTAKGILDWRSEKCAGQISLTGCEIDLDLIEMSISEAANAGIKTLILGVAPPGGNIPHTWHEMLFSAIDNGMDIASGLHDKLVDIPNLKEHAFNKHCQLFDVRHIEGDHQFNQVGTGKKRTGKRLLSVGTDCAVGKMYTSLAIEKSMLQRKLNVDFRATGQTGIFICGTGLSIDAVVSDFVSGAAEAISPANSSEHWDIIEGQGSLYHPSYAAVTLGLVHGSQPDAMILCHDVSRKHIIGVENYPIPDIDQCMQTYLQAAHLTNPQSKFIGISLNTSSLSEKSAKDIIKETEQIYNLPCTDPYRLGVENIVDYLVNTK